MIAGVRVTGSADEPKAEIFSDLSDVPAGSTLLPAAWSGPDSGQSDSAAISMLVGLGLHKVVVGKIGETFGVAPGAGTRGVGDSRRWWSALCTAGSAGKIWRGIFDCWQLSRYAIA